MRGQVERIGRYISHSQSQVWLDCEQRWWYNYKLGLISKEPAPFHLEMGDYLHGKLDIYYQLFEQTTEPAELYRLVEANILEDIVGGIEGELAHRAIKCMWKYIHEYSPVEDQGMEIVGSELRFEVPLITPTGRPFTFECYVDLLYKNRFGLLVVRDHKSSGQGKFWTDKQIEADPQQTLYIACLRALGYDVWRGELNFLNTYPYKDWASQPLNKLFRTKGATRTQDELDASLLWLGKMVDRQEELTEPQMRRQKSCAYCPYYAPCTHRFKGKDDAFILKLGFRRKDGYTEHHAAEANQNRDGDVPG